jgi:site-specific DNA-methyltransferase (adenine-specific)
MTEQAPWTQLEEVTFVHLNPEQIIFEDRAREVYANLDELAESIQEKGLIQALAVQATSDPDRYRLLAGGRRFSAATLARLRPLPCRVYPEELSELDAKEIELFENIHREDLTWKEKANLTRQVHEIKVQRHGLAISGGTGEEKRGHSMADTAELMGKDRTLVSKEITLSKALEEHPELEEAKTESDARRMLKGIKRREVHVAATKEFESTMSEEGEAGVKTRLCNSYIVGDFFERAADIPDKLANMIELDPPYAIDLPEIKKAESEVTDGYTEVEKQDYEDFMRRVLAECYRMLLPSGWIVCWHAYQWQDIIRNLMIEAGFGVAPVPAFWVKPVQGQTRQPEIRLGSVVEPFLYARKGSALLYQPGRNNSFIYHPVPSDKKIHPTERPIEMIEDLLATFCGVGGNVVVPFLGSGNTILAGANKGFHVFGFDIDAEEHYKQAFVHRVQTETLRQYKSYS